MESRTTAFSAITLALWNILSPEMRLGPTLPEEYEDLALPTGMRLKSGMQPWGWLLA